jgi:hypothetical protein
MAGAVVRAIFSFYGRSISFMISGDIRLQRDVYNHHVCRDTAGEHWGAAGRRAPVLPVGEEPLCRLYVVDLP